ncbi:hypothetical protein EMCRGX_G028036 [Ephydatia muelleri]
MPNNNIQRILPSSVLPSPSDTGLYFSQLPLISKDLTSQQYPSKAAPKLIVEHQQLQALHKEFCQQLREGELDQQATPSSCNMLAELEAIRHKRDEAAQQNEAPVAGSVEGQSVPVKIETLVKQ